jgi:hypothetical protein
MHRLITRHRIAAIALLVVIAIALLVPTVAFARAGGGHTSNPGRSGGGSSFGGSSGRSGGSGGSFLGGAVVGSALSGGGGGGLGFGGCCTLLIIIGIIVVIYTVMMRGKGGVPTPPDFSALSDLGQAPGMAPVSFDAIRADDPNFSEQAFYGRVNEMFLAIQKAWEARNMEPARRFLSEEQFQVLADGVGEYVRNGQINKLDSIHVDRLEPVSITREGGSDYVRMLVAASVIDYTIDERTGELVNPSVLGDGKTVKSFEEYWTLERKVGAQTKADASIKKCPNCGAPVTDGNYVKCAYCGTMMNNPDLDWVLLRIDQP